MIERTAAFRNVSVGAAVRAAGVRPRVPAVAPSLLALALVVVTVALFAPALWHDFVDWDDGINFSKNTGYRGLGWQQLRWMVTSTLTGHYIPLTWLTLGLDYVVWGMNPFGYHLTNILLHAANAALFSLLAARLFRVATSWSDAALRIAAAVAALFFALHPLRAESVAWVTERRDVLSGMFFLLTLLLYLTAVTAVGPRRRWLLAGAATCHLAGLGSKAIVMGLPLILIVLDIYPLRRLRGGIPGWWAPEARRIWLEKIPFLVLSVAGAATAYYAVLSEHFFTPLALYPWPARVAMGFYSLAFYVWKTAVPVALSPLYELPAVVQPLQWRFVGSALAVVALTVLTVALRRRWPAGLAVWASYVILLGPVTGVVHAGYQLAHDRYSYLSCLGLALLVGAGAGVLVSATGRGSVRPLIARLAGVVLATWLLGLALLTYHQIGIWRNSEALWTHATDADETCSLCHGNLGTYLVNHNYPTRGIEHLTRALELRPAHELRPDRAVKYYGALGLALYRLRRVDEALQAYHQALEADPFEPTVLVNISVALMHIRQPEQAVVYLNRALLREPDSGFVRTNLGSAFVMLGIRDRAVEEYQRAIAADPRLDLAHAGLARLYFEAGDLDGVRQRHAALAALGSRLQHEISPVFVEGW